MVLGSIRSKERPGTPSTTTNGSAFPKVLTPRIVIVAPSYPGSEVLETATTPGKRPANPCDTFVTGVFASFSPPTLVTEPDNVAFFWAP